MFNVIGSNNDEICSPGSFLYFMCHTSTVIIEFDENIHASEFRELVSSEFSKNPLMKFIKNSVNIYDFSHMEDGFSWITQNRTFRGNRLPYFGYWNKNVPSFKRIKLESLRSGNPTYPEIINSQRKIVGSGFHRILEISIELSTPFKEGEKLVLFDVLPRGLYVDEFELERHYKEEKFRVWNYERIDVEKPKSFGVPIFLEMVKSSLKDEKKYLFRYPIHIRYHSPSSKKDILKSSEVLNPSFFYVEDEKSDIKPFKEFFSELNIPIESFINLPIFRNRVLFGSVGNDGVEFDIPVGQIEDKSIVTFVTFTVTVGSTILLIIVTVIVYLREKKLL